MHNDMGSSCWSLPADGNFRGEEVQQVCLFPSPFLSLPFLFLSVSTKRINGGGRKDNGHQEQWIHLVDSKFQQ